MSNETNVIQIDNPKLGKYSMILTNDQLKELGKAGAKAIENTTSPTQPTKTGRMRISPDSQVNHPGGFIGNTIDWSSFFPNEDNAKVPELIQKAKRWEDNLELAMVALTTFIGAGLQAYTAGAGLPDLSNIPVSSIIGPFADLYAEENPVQAEELNKLIESFESIQRMMKEKQNA